MWGVATTELAGAVVASGTLVVATSVKKIQHPAPGAIGELRVRDADAGRAGQVLIRLDDAITRANLSAAENSLIELYARSRDLRPSATRSIAFNHHGPLKNLRTGRGLPK